MRRLLAPLLLLLPLLLASTPAVAQSPTPSSQAAPAVTLADDGRTVRLRPGQLLHVRLDPQPGAVWQGFEQGAPTLHLLTYVANERDGLSASLQALSAGRHGGSSALRPQELRAELVSRCTAASPACPAAPRTWSVQVVVEDGPADTSDVACSPTARPTASAAPGTVLLTETDDGRTVTVPRDGRVVVQLDSGCGGTDWTPPRSGAPLFREAARVDRPRGQVDALFTPQASGTTTVTAVVDARCLHRTDAAGNGTCAVVQRAYSVTVQVVESASPRPCTRPTYEAWRLSATRVAAGDPVVVQGGRDDLCVDDAQEPERTYVVHARPEGGTEAVVATERGRTFSTEVRPRTTTTYRVTMDGQPLRAEGGADTVTVDRVSGSCLGQVSLSGPTTTAPGARAELGGSAAPGSTVRVLFRRYGQPAFTARRLVTAAADGRFRVGFAVDEDHRWYAATDRCDSPAGLTRARPRITGPAVVRRGDTVTLRVEAVRGVRTTVFFRGAGEAFTARRVLSGPGTVTYRATSDQRWYAQTRDLASGAGLTQVR